MPVTAADTQMVEELLTEFGVGTEWPKLSDADSFTILSFFLALEKKMGVPLSADELVPRNFESIATILEIVARAPR